ncbi:patatin-like phospholipase family protein [Rhizobium alvei]|uniref:Patatin-like phospholipase family protein n=1 Tax=Rhizobium alvei TaxID=1132659 RepID=A0ABT8YKK3_9HYPH|nr:patatin-like phospholipase family protein [Rhizobium alvei]MDO6964056.1 patatin-like phospholipase family protein [Rhizobium alvei]
MVTNAHDDARSVRMAMVSMLLVIALLLSGCSPEARASYTAPEAEAATLVGFENVRTYLDAPLKGGDGDAAKWAPDNRKPKVDFLMISGGGAGGAFTVGILSAWSATGTRPKFDVVTGVSTGALIAPYAFLGEAYDQQLVKLYTSGTARNLVEARWMGTGLFQSSLLKPEPLRHLVNKYVTWPFLARIAAEHRKGRRLLILTTDLDTQRAVVWNMGEIAASGRMDSLSLFRDVLIASASIPGIFPAVRIKAQVAGRQIEEMHSDGGSASQVLTLPEQLIAEGGKLAQRKNQKINFYVIVNNALMPEFSTTPDQTLPVMARAYSILIKSQTRASLLALYGYAKRTGAEFHLASINKQIPYSVSDPFNTDYMRTVYAIGYAEMKNGTVWKDRPI